MGTLKKALASMQGGRVYFDTNMFIYFLEGDETYFQKCLPFFQAVEDGAITGISGDLAVAELLVKPLSTHDIFGAEKVRTLFNTNGFFTALAHDREVLEFAAHIRASQKIAMIDAIHLATAIHGNCSHIITNDEKVAKRAKGIQALWLGDMA
jgi:predicted nucleic acid-binding protein